MSSDSPNSPEAPVPPPLSVSEERIQLFNLSLDLLCVAGIDGYFRHVNPSWTRVLGWTEEELLSRPVEFFMHPEDRARTLEARSGLSRGIPVRGLENRYLCKDGTYRWLSWQCTIEPGGNTVFGVARDITDRRQSDREHLILGKLESSAMLAAGMAHDFNNLLTGLQLNLDMVELAGPISTRQAQNLQQAREAVESARRLTQQLVAFSRRDGPTGRRVIRAETLLRESFAVALRGTSLRGDCRVVPDLWPVEVNEEELGQVIRNLVSNARDAMPAGGGLVLRADNVTLGDEHGPEYPAGNYIRVTLIDEGGGMPPEVLSRVFDPYFSTKHRGTGKGMGLGLTICHAVVQKHGGMMTINPEGRGTAVSFYLPVAPAGDGRPVEEVSAARSTPTVAVGSPASCAVKRVLVMDDEPVVREVVEQILLQLGCEVVLSADSAGALETFARCRREARSIHLVLLDLTIRGGPGGVETLRGLRELDPDVRAVLMTGYGNESAASDYRTHGFVGVLGKPFSVDDLKGVLNRHT